MADPWKAKPNIFHSPFGVLTARQRVKLRGTQTPPTPLGKGRSLYRMRRTRAIAVNRRPDRSDWVSGVTLDKILGITTNIKLKFN